MSFYVKLARQAAEHYVRTQELLPVPDSLPSDVAAQRSCYVYIYENPGRRLRAAYGERLPQQPTLAQEIITNTARAVAANEARVVRRIDLAYLAYSVALLGPLQRISDAVHLDPRVYGLYVRSDRGMSALLLPQRVGIETAQDQIATALREANIDARQEQPVMYRFEVTFYDE